MRHIRNFISLTLGFAFAPAYGADGIRASAIATRTAPADVMTVSFQITEAAPEPGKEPKAMELAVLTSAFEARGIKVLEATEGRLAFVNNNFNNNFIDPQASRAKVGKQLLFRLCGFSHSEDVGEVLFNNGIRQNITYTYESTQFEVFRSDLQREAITKAVGQAKEWARDAGVKAGDVIDLSVTPVNSPVNLPFSMPANTTQTVLRWNLDQNIIPPAKEGDPSLIRYTVVATVVLAAKSE